MQIVIDIPDKYKDNYKVVYNGSMKAEEILDAIINGTPLPENHGKIVDLGNIDKDRIEQNNPVMTINIYGAEIEAVPLDYLYNLPDLINKDGE